MKFFTAKQNEEIAAKLEAAESENESLRADLEAAQARVGELTSLSEVNAQLQADLSDVQAKLAEADKLANENAQTIADLTAAAEVTEEKVSIKAAELLAAQGHPKPVDLTGDAGISGTDHVAELGKLQGAERTAYYNQHKAEIRKALNKA